MPGADAVDNEVDDGGTQDHRMKEGPPSGSPLVNATVLIRSAASVSGSVSVKLPETARQNVLPCRRF